MLFSRYKAEPYAIAADIYAARGQYGRGGWSHYTGAAAWYCKIMLEEMMGVRLTDGFSRISVRPLFKYSLRIEYNGYRLTVNAVEGLEMPQLDGATTAFPLDIPDGEHILNVGLK